MFLYQLKHVLDFLPLILSNFKSILLVDSSQST